MSSFEFPSTGTTDASAMGVPATKGAIVVLVIGMAGMSPQQQQLLVTQS